MISILKKEIQSFFNSLIAYVVIGVFLTGLGLYIWVFPDTLLDYQMADLSTFFTAAPFVFMFLVPGITMRSFSEEKNNGTIELLLTKPISEWNLILGKYFAVLFIVGIALIPTLVYYYSVYQLGNPVGNIDSARAFGSYLGLFLLGSVFASVGIFTSSLTKNQIVAFALAAFACLILFEGIAYLSQIFEWSGFGVLFQYISLSEHYTDLSKGVIDSRDVLYLVSVSFIFLQLTKLVLLSRKWK